MSYRKITINDKNFFYKVGLKFVEIKDESRKICVVSKHKLKGMSEKDYVEATSKVNYFVSDESVWDAIKEKDSVKQLIKSASILPSDIKKYLLDCGYVS